MQSTLNHLPMRAEDASEERNGAIAAPPGMERGAEGPAESSSAATPVFDGSAHDVAGAPLLQRDPTTSNELRLSRDAMLEAARALVQHGYQLTLLYGTDPHGVCACPLGARCRSAGKHPRERNWVGRPIRTLHELQGRWERTSGTPNLGIMPDDGLIVIDIDRKNGKRGGETLAALEAEHGVLGQPDQITPSSGSHFVFRLPAGTDPATLPNRSGVFEGIDILRIGRQFVAAPSQIGARRYQGSLPPREQLPVLSAGWLTLLQSLGGDTQGSRAPMDVAALEARLQELKAPSIEKVREVVSRIPNPGDTDRNDYVWMAHAVKSACGSDAVGDGLEIFMEWAAKWDGSVDPIEDERVFTTIAWQHVQTGWPDLWKLAARHGYDATAERLAEAQAAFSVVALSEDTAVPAATANMHSAQTTALPIVPVRSFADVTPTPIEWLLPGRLARQQITMINGWPGEGKTSVVIDLVARMTRAERLPDDTVPSGPLRVLFLSTEDSESILHQRLRAAGADLDRVLTIPDTDLQRLTLPSHQATWIQLLQHHNIDVIVVDPMKAFLDDGLKDIAEQDARKFMLALRQICEITNVAAISIRHPNKATASGHSTAISAASGSLGFTAAARIELLVGRMPDDEEIRALVHVKNNLAAAPPALLYRIVSKDVFFDKDSAATQSVAGIDWVGVDDKIQADDLLARRQGREDRSKLEEAKEFLKQFLASGPVEHKTVRSAAKRLGIAVRTLERARLQVGWTSIVGNLHAGGTAIWGLEGHGPADFRAVGTTTPAETERIANGDGTRPSGEPALERADLSDLEA